MRNSFLYCFSFSGTKDSTKDKHILSWQEFEKRRRLTRRLKPVTLVRAVAMATADSETWPRCPTITTDATCKRYCDTVATTIGAAKQPTFFSSPANPPHVTSSHLFSSLLPSCIFSTPIQAFFSFLFFESRPNSLLLTPNWGDEYAYNHLRFLFVWL